MAPEKGTATKPSRRRCANIAARLIDLVTHVSLPPPLHYNPPPVEAVTPPSKPVPPSMYVPQTGRSLPNLPTARLGSEGARSSQDRAARCAHQAGVYGQAAGDRNTYVGGCINQ